MHLSKLHVDNIFLINAELKFILSLVNRVLHLIRNPPRKKKITFCCVSIKGKVGGNISPELKLFSLANKIESKNNKFYLKGGQSDLTLAE